MKKFVMLVIVCLAFVSGHVLAEVDYSIPLYQGNLTIAADNTAQFEQKIFYDFASSYNGQYVTLGQAGNLPKGFKIGAKPSVEAYRVGKSGQLTPRFIKSEVEALSDGYRLKVYNQGNAGDRILVKAKWSLTKPTTLYQDIAELNWVPISDWDVTLKRVELKVQGPGDSLSHQLYAHTGYFKKAPKMSRHTNAIYTISLDKGLAKGQQLELHGYWPRSLFTVTPDVNQKGITKFQKIEKKIVFWTRFFPILLGGLLPAVALILLVISAIYYLAFKKLAQQKRLDKRTYLFNLPGNVSPLIAAHWLYDLEMRELSPLTVKGKRYGLDFSHLIQATFLDLLDQGKIHFSEDKTHFLVPKKSLLTSYEAAFLTFVFGNHTIKIDNAFLDYRADKSILKKGSESQIRQRGRYILSQFKARLTKLDKELKLARKQLELPELHRDMTQQEKRYWDRIAVISAIALLFSLAVGIFCLIKGYYWGVLINGLVCVSAMLVSYYYYRRSDYYKVARLLTTEGLEKRQMWDAFQNMVRDIKTFNKVDLEGVVVWNRLLVYATLYGYADRVTDYLQFNQIHLGNEDVTLYLNSGFFHGFYLSTNHVSTYTATAQSASNFSVSTSSGGGFSGGGGGGGGGAF